MDGLIGVAFPLLGLVGLLLLLRPRVAVGHAVDRADPDRRRRAEAAGANPRRRQHPAS